jgi:hypothetical protein
MVEAERAIRRRRRRAGAGLATGRWLRSERGEAAALLWPAANCPPCAVWLAGAPATHAARPRVTSAHRCPPTARAGETSSFGNACRRGLAVTGWGPPLAAQCGTGPAPSAGVCSPRLTSTSRLQPPTGRHAHAHMYCSAQPPLPHCFCAPLQLARGPPSIFPSNAHAPHPLAR